MTNITLTREQVEKLRETMIDFTSIPRAGINALCDLALQAIDMRPKEKWSYGHCEEKKRPNGCQLHNLHCQYPECDRRPLSALPTGGE